MARHYKCDLFSGIGPDRIADVLKLYAQELSAAAERTRKRLAEDAAEQTRSAYMMGRSGFDVRQDDSVSDDPVYGIQIEDLPAARTSCVHAEGEDALFLEFGAGQLNGTPGTAVNDAAARIGATVGSYPSDTAARNVARGFWHTPDGGIAVGTYATCGMYDAGKKAHENAEKVLREEMKQL